MLSNDKALEAAAALVVLARYNIPVDVQELLVSGDPMRGIRPGALCAALTAVREGGEPLRLTGEHISELHFLARNPGLWRGCPPDSGKVDSDLRLYIDRKLVVWTGNGYAITNAGLAALFDSPSPPASEGGQG